MQDANLNLNTIAQFALKQPREIERLKRVMGYQACNISEHILYDVFVNFSVPFCKTEDYLRSSRPVRSSFTI